MIETVTANGYWVWTKNAEKKNPDWSKAGEEIWYHYRKRAPKEWLDDGLIIDSTEYIREGQASIFDYL